MNCSKCGEPASVQHIGAVAPGDFQLCHVCNKLWQEMNEAIRLRFIDHLKESQAFFLRAPAPAPTEVAPAPEESENVDLGAWVQEVIPEPVEIPAEESPLVEFSETELSETEFLSDEKTSIDFF